MDDPNITGKRLEEEKDQKRGKVFNCENAKYGKIWYDEDVHNLRYVETEFPAIVFNDILMSKPTVSSLNDEIDFRFSFNASDDEDYTIIFDKTHFENEFSAIVYNDALTSKSYFITEPTIIPQHIDEFNLKDETSLPECDEEEQNVLYFNVLFSFNIIYPDDSKSDEDNDDDKIDGGFIEVGEDLQLRDTLGSICGFSRDAQAYEGRSVRWSQETFKLEVVYSGLGITYRGGDGVLRFAAGRKSGAHISGGHFVGRLAQHFRLLTGGPWDERGNVMFAGGAPGVAQDVHVIDEGGQANPAPVQASPPLPAAARTMP
ncbi:hypothetical protein Tco_0561977 [Tanacetum coccineum]